MQTDLFPDVTERQKQQASEAAAAAQSSASASTAATADVVPGWQCAHCHYFNQPQQDECFGCEKDKKVEPATAGSPRATGSTISTASALSTLACTRRTRIPASFARSSPPDLWVQSSWQSALCACDDCTALCRSRAPFLLTPDDSSDSDDDDDEAAADGDEAAADGGGEVRSTDELVEGYLSSLPRHALMEGMDAMREWNEAVMRRIQSLVGEHGDSMLITGEMMTEVTQQASEEVEATRRRRREAMDELHDADGDESSPSKRGRFEE